MHRSRSPRGTRAPRRTASSSSSSPRSSWRTIGITSEVSHAARRERAESGNVGRVGGEVVVRHGVLPLGVKWVSAPPAEAGLGVSCGSELASAGRSRCFRFRASIPRFSVPLTPGRAPADEHVGALHPKSTGKRDVPPRHRPHSPHRRTVRARDRQPAAHAHAGHARRARRGDGAARQDLRVARHLVPRIRDRAARQHLRHLPLRAAARRPPRSRRDRGGAGGGTARGALRARLARAARRQPRTRQRRPHPDRTAGHLHDRDQEPPRARDRRARARRDAAPGAGAAQRDRTRHRRRGRAADRLQPRLGRPPAGAHARACASCPRGCCSATSASSQRCSQRTKSTRAHELVAQALLEHHARGRPRGDSRYRVRAAHLPAAHWRSGR